jgi:uncharacterized membrane protein
MSETNPLVERYLSKLEAGLRDLAPAERAEVVGEIRNHIAEASSAGKPIDAVLTSLGPAEDLSRGYAVELLLNPKRAETAQMSRTRRFFALAGLVAIGSLPTFIAVVILGTIGITFAMSGVLVFVAGLCAAFGVLPDYITMDVAPWVAVLIGPALSLLGIGALAALIWYVKFTARLVRRVLPRHVPA